jgi:hypothetical protein
MNKSKRGGYRPGSGRKPKDPDHPLNKQWTFAVSEAERDALRERGGEWARRVLRRALRREGAL